jgi:hypothetical protein
MKAQGARRTSKGGSSVNVRVVAVVAAALFLAGCGGSGGLSPAGQSFVDSGQAKPGDEQFLSTLDKQAVTYQNPPGMIQTAHSVCDALGQGNSTEEITQTISGSGSYSPADATKIVDAARSAYCHG